MPLMQLKLIEEDAVLVMWDRLMAKGRCEMPMHVNIFQEEELVATADMILEVSIENFLLSNCHSDC